MHIPRTQVHLPTRPPLPTTLSSRMLLRSDFGASETVITTVHKIIDLSLTVRIQFLPHFADPGARPRHNLDSNLDFLPRPPPL